MKKKTAVVLATLTAGALMGSCVIACIDYLVYAKGNMDFKIDGSTLTAYLGDDTFVSIPDNVKTIGKGAFADNSTLRRVTLPKKLETIEYNAFGNCTALEDITIPDSVKKVGPGAFSGCTALSMVEIGSNVSSWGSGVFNDCTSLSKLMVDKDNLYLSYYNGALYNGNMTFLYQVLSGRAGNNYVMPEEVEDMDTYAFWNMQNLKNVSLSENISEVASFTMSNMGSVENVVLPDSVESISEKAFSNNQSLKQVRISDGVSAIHKNAFSNCPNVKLLVEKDGSVEKYANEQKLSVIYEAEYPVAFIDSNEYLEEKPDKTVTIVKEKKVTEKTEKKESQTEQGDNEAYEHPLDTQEEGVIGKTIIAGGQAFVLLGNDNQKVYGTAKQDVVDHTEETEEVASEVEPEKTISEAGSLKEEEKNQNENEDSQIIKERKYYKQNSLTNYEISETIKEIKRLAFARSGLKKIIIPQGVEAIGYGAFYACENLKEVVISDSVTTIETKAFADTLWLSEWLEGGNNTGDGSDFLVVGDGILLAYRGNESIVTVPDNVKQIGSEAFKGHEELTEISISQNVTKINAEAFRNCTNLEKVNGCKGLKTVIRGAFYGTKIDEESLSK